MLDLPKAVGFLRILRFPPTGDVVRMGLDSPQTNSSIVNVAVFAGYL